MNQNELEEFILGYNRIQKEVHEIAKEKGWWDAPCKTPLECVCLMHSELSEAAEAVRDTVVVSNVIISGPKSKKAEGVSNLEEELADTVIRIMDFCGWNNFNLAAAILKKMEYNRNRPYKHGRKL